MRWMVLSLALLLGGCSGNLAGMLSTGSIGGGPSGGQVAGSLHTVRVAYAQGDTAESVQSKALIEAARQARQAGATHFIVVRTSEAAAMADTAVTSLSQPKSEFQIYIRLVTLPPDAQMPVGAVSVEEIEKYVAGDVAKPRG